MKAGLRAGHRIGLVGCGGFGSFVGRILTGRAGPPGAHLVAVADADPVTVTGLADELVASPPRPTSMVW